MKKIIIIVLLGVSWIASPCCLAKSSKDEQLKECALCGTLAVVQESFLYPFICRLCCSKRMKGNPIITITEADDVEDKDFADPNPDLDLVHAIPALAAASKHAVRWYDTEHQAGGLSVPFSQKESCSHTLNFDRFFVEDQLVARRSKRIVFLRPARTGHERKNKKAFMRSIEEESKVSHDHMWRYLVAQDNTYVTAQNALLARPEKTYFTRKPFTKMLYRNGCVVFVLPSEYEVYDFSSHRTMVFPFAKKDELERYLYKEGHGGQFKEYAIAASLDTRKMSSIGVIPTFYYALTNGKKTLLVGNNEGYIFTWELGVPVDHLFARADQVAVVADGHQFFQDLSRHQQEEAVMVHDHPIDVLVIPNAEQRHLREQGFVKIEAPEKTVDMFIKELAVVPESCTYDIYQVGTLDALAIFLKKSEEPFRKNRKFSYSLTIEQDEESDEQEAVIKATGKVLLDNGHEDAWDEEIVLNSSKDQVWYRDGQVVTWDHDDLISFDYENKEAKRFVFPEGVTRESVATKMPELAFSELRQAGQ